MNKIYKDEIMRFIQFELREDKDIFKTILDKRKNQIELVTDFYIHTGNYMTPKEIEKNGNYIFEKITKEQMLEFIYNPQKGEKVLKKYLGGK